MISVYDVVAGGYAVNCKTQLEADEFVAAIMAMFPEECQAWVSGSSYEVHGRDTCYSFSTEFGGKNRMYFSNIEFYRMRPNTVIVNAGDISFNPIEIGEGDLGEIDTDGMSIEFLFGTLEVAE